MELLLNLKPCQGKTSLALLKCISTKNKYSITIENENNEILSHNRYDDHKSALLAFVNSIESAKNYRTLLNSHNAALLEYGKNGENQFSEIFLLVYDSCPSFLIDEIESITNLEHFPNQVHYSNVKLKNRYFLETNIPDDHITVLNKGTYIIAALKYVGAHFDGYEIIKELVTDNAHQALEHFISLDGSQIKYNLYKTTSFTKEFKIDNYGEPVNELSVLMAKKQSSSFIEPKTETDQVILIYAEDDKINSDGFINCTKQIYNAEELQSL